MFHAIMTWASNPDAPDFGRVTKYMPFHDNSQVVDDDGEVIGQLSPEEQAILHIEFHKERFPDAFVSDYDGPISEALVDPKSKTVSRVPLPVPPAPPEISPVEKLTAFLSANPDVAALIG